MKTMKFKVTLLSDVILNVRSASEGNQQTLDFIPGNNFLGICAKTLYDMDDLQTVEIFHSGNVRFGDAHLGYANQRGVKIPAVMHYPKLEGITGNIYLSHLIEDSDDVSDLQLKQCREGFYLFDSKEQVGSKVQVEKNFAIKSAHDREKRTSKASQMFGYESLQKGAELFFSVEVDNDAIAQKIENTLIGEKQLGRSRTAQYGLIRIESCDYLEPETTSASGEVAVYADGRLIFLDENTLQPTFRPTALQLGFPEGEIVWSKSQVRTFQYAPWNFKRQCFDTDRCGIEKGSVFVVKTNTSVSGSRYVGSYNNEGFGKIIINPDFLASKFGSYLSAYKLGNLSVTDNNEETPVTAETLASPLMKYVASAKKHKKMEHGIYAKVNNFVEHKAGIFKGSTFASQWGTIRTIAISVKDDAVLYDAINDYLSHGVAQEKWEERLRKDALMNFIEELSKDDDARLAIINLASEMQKKCRG